jgi:hypothetical protein
MKAIDVSHNNNVEYFFHILGSPGDYTLKGMFLPGVKIEFFLKFLIQIIFDIALHNPMV